MLHALDLLASDEGYYRQDNSNSRQHHTDDDKCCLLLPAATFTTDNPTRSPLPYDVQTVT